MPDPALGPSSPLVPPLYAASVYTLPDLDALDDIYEGRAPGYIYARDAHPNAAGLADRLAKLEGAAWGIVCGSGMASLSAAFLGLLSAGDKVVGVHGGSAAQQCLAAGLLDEFLISLAPVVLGSGTRLFDHLDGQYQFEQTSAIATPNATHLRFKVIG